MRQLGNKGWPIDEFLNDGGAFRDDRPHRGRYLTPSDHPHDRIYHDVTPLWHDGESAEDLDDSIGDAYSCGFSAGFERGVVMALMKPEWAVGWYRAVREYYRTSDYAPKDLESWGHHAEHTASALPVPRREV